MNGKMKRPLCVFTVFFGICAALFNYLGIATGSKLFICLIIALVIYTKCVVKKFEGFCLQAVCALLVCGIAFFVQSNFSYQNSLYFEGKTCHIVGTITQIPKVNEKGTYIYEVLTEYISDDKMLFQSGLKINLYSNEDLGFAPMQRVYVRGRVFTPSSAYFEGGFDSQTYYKSRGVYLFAYTEKGLTYYIEEKQGNWFKKSVLTVKMELFEVLNSLSNPTKGLLTALILGEKSELAEEVKEDFATIGISHMLAVSGMHLSIVAGVVNFIFIILLGKRRLGALCVLGVCIFYGAITGFGASVARSVIMHVMMCGGILLRRDYDSKTGLAASVCIILLLNPFGVGDIGLQLSVASTLGIVLMEERLQRYFMKILPKKDGKFSAVWNNVAKGMLSSVVITLCAVSFSAPLLVLFFQELSIICVAANFLLVFSVTALFVLGGFYVTLCMMGVHFSFLYLMLQWITAYIMKMAHWLAAIPFASIHIASQNMVWFAFFCLGVLCLTLVWGRGEKRRLIPFAIGGMFVFFLLMPSNVSNQGFAEVSFIDVGQGDCTYIKTKNANVLIDCGSSSEGLKAGERAGEYILFYGETTLDYAMFTHYHSDHINGFEALCQTIRVKNVIVPPFDGSENSKQLVAVAKKYGVNLIEATSDKDFMINGEIQCKVYTQHIRKEEMLSNANEQCVVYEVLCADTSILLTGDIQRAGEVAFATAYDVDSDILKVAHHGSTSSSYYKFLDEITPTYAIISCKENNSYGHPSREVLYRLSQYTDYIGRVDKKGSIRLIIKEDGIYEQQ